MRIGVRSFYLAISAVGLILFLWAFYGQIDQAKPLEAAALAAAKFPIMVSGRIAGSPEELDLIVDGHRPGGIVSAIDAAGVEHQISLRPRNSPAALLVTLLSGLFFWAVASFIFAPRADRGDVRDFYWCTCLYGLAVMAGGIHFPGTSFWPAVLRSFLRLGSLAALPVIFLHLTLSFPRRGGLLDRAPWLMPGLAAMMIVIAGVEGLAYWRYVAETDLTRAHALETALQLGRVALIILVTVAFGVLFVSSRRLPLTRERLQVRWLLWGIAVGAFPYVYLRAAPQLAGLPPPLSPQIERLFALAIPTSFAFSVVRYRFLDIDIIIRRSLIYAILAAGMIGLYLAAGVAVGQRFQSFWASWAGLLLIGLGLLAGIMFQPLRGAIGRWVDRTFFKIGHDYGRAIAMLTRELANLTAQRDVCQSLAAFLVRMLRPQRVLVLVRGRGGELLTSGADIREPGRIWDAAAHSVRGSERALVAVGSSSLPELEEADFPEELRVAEYVVVEPIQLEGQLLGLLLLGRRETERSYVETDLELIAQSARAAAHVLERIRLVQIADEQTQARQRLDELSRMKSDFLSRVAHDLRTPLASISWSTENLLDGVAGEIVPAQADYLRSIKVSARHLNRLVGNLLEISRLEQGRIALEMEPIDLVRVLDESMVAARPLAESKQVSLRLRQHADEVIAQGDRGKLLEITVNLLDNAMKYSPPDGSVEIDARSMGPGWVGFTVRDHGPGLAADFDGAFERFQQGQPSPYSQQHGFGLGLFIVKSYVDLMGGEITGENHPDGGALFTCRLRKGIQ